MKIRLELFRPTVRSLWATTYTFEPMIIEDLFIARVHEQCAITVLADARTLRRTWARLVAENPDGLRRANRRYLIRGVERGRRAFHPKTVLALEPHRAQLLVGSGNLTMGGLLNGHELSVLFDGGTAAGSSAIHAWLDWSQALVDHLADDQVTRRFAQLRDALPPLVEPDDTSAFVHNLQASLVDQLRARVGDVAIDRLHVMAPFWDEDLRALGRLLSTFRPRCVDILVCTGANVDGRRLRDLADAYDGEIRLLQSQPGEFVHAKAVGVVSGDRGWLLSGSANCSSAALVELGWHGNAECGSLIEVPAQRLSALFTDGLSLRPLTQDMLDEFTWTQDRPDVTTVDDEPAVALAAARRLPDGRIEAHYATTSSDVMYVMGMEQRPVGPLQAEETLGSTRVARTPSGCDPADFLALAICDAAGDRLSGWIPVDDPRTLTGTPKDTQSTVPVDLQQEDLLTEAGQVLQYIDGDMDYSVLFAFGGGGNGQGGSTGSEDGNASCVIHADDLTLPWRPRHLGRLPTGPDTRVLDEILRDLATYRDRLPPLPSSNTAPAGRLSTEDDEALDDDGQAPDTEPGYATDTQEQVEQQGLAAISGLSPGARRRLFNALKRRTAAAGSRRLYVDDTAAAIQFMGRVVTVLHSLATDARRSTYIAEDRLAQLTEHLLATLSGTVDAPGLLTILSDEDRRAVVAGLGSVMTARFTELVLSLVGERPSTHHARQLEWQPVIEHAVDLGILDADDEALLERLFWAATHLDDKHWERMVTQGTGIDGIRVRRGDKRPVVEIPLTPATELLMDPRVPKVLLCWQLYTQSNPSAGAPGTVTLAVPGDTKTRVALTNHRALAMSDGKTAAQTAQLTIGALRQLVSRSAPLAELLVTNA